VERVVAVYVDDAENALGRMKLCHMLADTKSELFAMADTIGVARRWYQGFERASCPHFDVSKGKRALAVQHGAVVVGRHELGALIRRIKTDALARVKAKQSHGWEA
jgi:hypothetical protein